MFPKPSQLSGRCHEMSKNCYYITRNYIISYGTCPRMKLSRILVHCYQVRLTINKLSRATRYIFRAKPGEVFHQIGFWAISKIGLDSIWRNSAVENKRNMAPILIKNGTVVNADHSFKVCVNNWTKLSMFLSAQLWFET